MSDRDARPPPPRLVHDDRPAPVISDEGTFGALPPRPRYDYEFDEEPRSPRSAALVVASGLLAIVLAAWALAFSAAQATSETVALAVHERGIATLTELEALLRFHREEIMAGAQRGTGVPIPGYPVQGMTLTPEEAASGDVARWHASLVERSARLTYEDGVLALVPEGIEEPSTSLFSTGGGIKRALDMLSASNHERATALLMPLGIATAVLAVAVLVLGRGLRRFVTLGIVALIAAVPVFLAGAAARFFVSFIGSDGSVLADEFSAMTSEVTTLPLRNALILAATGVAILVPSVALNALFAGSLRRAHDDAPADAGPVDEPEPASAGRRRPEDR